MSLPNIGPHDSVLAAIIDLTTALGSLAKTAPAIARQGQLHTTPTSLSSDLMQFVASLYPPAAPSYLNNSTPLLQQEPTLPHPASLQRVSTIVDYTTANRLLDSEAATQEPQEHPQSLPQDQRVAPAPQHDDTNTSGNNILHAVVNDETISTPVIHKIVQTTSPIQQNILPELMLIAPNVPFSKMSSRTKTRPVPCGLEGSRLGWGKVLLRLGTLGKQLANARKRPMHG